MEPRGDGHYICRWATTGPKVPPDTFVKGAGELNREFRLAQRVEVSRA